MHIKKITNPGNTEKTNLRDIGLISNIGCRIPWKGPISIITVKKLNKKPLKNSTFQLKCNVSEMLKKHFLIVIVLPGKVKKMKLKINTKMIEYSRDVTFDVISVEFSVGFVITQTALHGHAENQLSLSRKYSKYSKS